MSSRHTPAFEVGHETEVGETLLCGLSEFGHAGLTAVSHLVEQLGLIERGHVRANRLPSVTPFEAETPRHHTRLFSGDDGDFTVDSISTARQDFRPARPSPRTFLGTPTFYETLLVIQESGINVLEKRFAMDVAALRTYPSWTGNRRRRG